MIKEHAAVGTHQKVIELLKNEKKGLVLDAASGEGALSQNLQNLGFDVTACELQPENFKAKNIRCDKINLNDNLPYQNEIFDYVVSVETIEHLENPWHFLREISRVLKVNGKLILTTPNINSISSRILFLYNLNYHDFEEYTYHVSPINFTVLSKMLSDSGFIVESINTNKFIKPKFSLLFHVLYPLLKPQNKIILLGDILIVKAKKVERNEE